VKLRSMLAVLAVAVLVLGPASAALADGGGEDFTATQFVEQAIGLLRGQPDMMDLIEDRITDALEDDEPEGVDLELVEQARQAFEAGDLDETRELLARSIGEEDSPILHEPEVGGGLQAPEGTAGPVLIGLALLLVGTGAVIARRVR
jgi:hypothetical protein